MEQDDEGDAITVYRCRKEVIKVLVCAHKGALGHGLEFRKQEK